MTTSSVSNQPLEEALLEVLRPEVCSEGLQIWHAMARSIHRLEDGSLSVSTYSMGGRQTGEELFSDDRVAVRRFLALVTDSKTR
jgi:hypothetical protein